MFLSAAQSATTGLCYGCVTLYFLALGLLALFGLHRLFIIYLYLRHRHHTPRPAGHLASLPRVTVQLPLFNEQYVAERLIEAACRLDWPRDRLEVQVLDDSIDRTVEVVAAKVAAMRGRGFDICHLRRGVREGFKAGALRFGLERAKGGFIAVFDADFLPQPDFLRQTLDYFSDPAVAMVQTRWDHLNRGQSLLTRVQAMLLDGHFVLEHTARHRSGRLFNFNGTSGVWRKEAIIDAGGWQWDTLTEDLDLSYRAQLLGWRFVYLVDVATPAELPVELAAFRRQQRRWAKGSIETARKLLPGILASPLSWRCKMEALFHLGANLCYPVTAALAMLAVPALVARIELGLSGLVWLDAPIFVAATLPVFGSYLLAERELGLKGWRQAVLVLPLMAVGVCLGVSCGGGVLEALRGRRTPFSRTAKFGLRDRTGSWRNKAYRSSSPEGARWDAGLTVLFAAGLAFALLRGVWASLPFLSLFQFAFAYSLWTSLRQHYGWGSGA